MDGSTVFRGLVGIQERIQGPEFEAWRKNFVAEHVDKFSYEDENKLEYTEIHQSYEAQIEQHIEAGLPKDIALADFMAALEGYLEGPEGSKEETSKVVALLLEVSDFRAFREMMLHAKTIKDEASIAQSDKSALNFEAKSVLEVEGLMDMCAAMSAASSDDSDGWSQVLKQDWIVIERKPIEPEVRRHKDESYMRTVMTMNLSYVECVDMMAYWGERRKLWDSSFKGMDLPFGDDFLLDDDCRVTERIDHGTLLHMAGVPRSLDLKFYRRWDHPAKGQVTTALVPWNHKKDCLDPDNSILTVKCSTIMPHPADPSKTIITTLEINKLGRMPKWILNILCTFTAPQIMRGLEQRYIANVRKAGKTLDLTTAEARKKAAQEGIK